MATIPTANGMQVTDFSGPASLPGYSLELGNQVDEWYGKSVANAAALPAAGKFAGQRVWLLDIKSHAIWTGTSWSYDTAPTALTLASGWTGTATIYRRGQVVFLELDILRSTWTAATAIATLSSGFLPAAGAHLLGRDASSPFTATRSVAISTAGAVTADVAGTNGISGSTQWGI